jgi:hypothetical protein
MLKMFPFSLKAVTIQVEHYLLPGVVAQKPNTNFFLHEEGVPLVAVLRIHLST